jgi:amidophosphoribosyltransferase
MSDVDELFAPKYLGMNTPAALDKVPFDQPIPPAVAQEMTAFLGASSLMYLPVASIANAIGRPSGELCQACLTGHYPTEAGNRLYLESLERSAARCSTPGAVCGESIKRIFELETPARL